MKKLGGVASVHSLSPEGLAIFVRKHFKALEGAVGHIEGEEGKGRKEGGREGGGLKKAWTLLMRFLEERGPAWGRVMKVEEGGGKGEKASRWGPPIKATDSSNRKTTTNVAAAAAAAAGGGDGCCGGGAVAAAAAAAAAAVAASAAAHPMPLRSRSSSSSSSTSASVSPSLPPSHPPSSIIKRRNSISSTTSTGSREGGRKSPLPRVLAGTVRRNLMKWLLGQGQGGREGGREGGRAVEQYCNGVNRLLLCLLEGEGGREGGRELDMEGIQTLMARCEKRGGLEACVLPKDLEEGEEGREEGGEGGLRVAWNILAGYVASMDELMTLSVLPAPLPPALPPPSLSFPPTAPTATTATTAPPLITSTAMTSSSPPPSPFPPTPRVSTAPPSLPLLPSRPPVEAGTKEEEGEGRREEKG